MIGMCWIDELEWPQIDSTEFESAMNFRASVIAALGGETWNRLVTEFLDGLWDEPPESDYYERRSNLITGDSFWGEPLFQIYNGDYLQNRSREIGPKLTGPDFVGSVMQMIGDLRPNDRDEWENHYRDSDWNLRIVEAGLLMAQKMTFRPPFTAAFSREFIVASIHFVKNLVIDRTYNGWMYGEVVFLERLSEEFPMFHVRRASAEEDERMMADIIISLDEHFRIGIQVKPKAWDGVVSSTIFSETYSGRIIVGRYKMEQKESRILGERRFLNELINEIVCLLNIMDTSTVHTVAESMDLPITGDKERIISRIWANLPIAQVALRGLARDLGIPRYSVLSSADLITAISSPDEY
jgi:hypothetical protein